MNIVTLLENDHRKVEQLFGQLEQAVEETKQLDIAAQITQELSVHADAEEEVLYPRMKQFPELQEYTDHSYKEHEEIRACISQLESEPVGTKEWRDTSGALKKTVEHHVKEEEQKIFPLLLELVAEARLEEWGRDLQRAKENKPRLRRAS